MGLIGNIFRLISCMSSISRHVLDSASYRSMYVPNTAHHRLYFPLQQSSVVIIPLICVMFNTIAVDQMCTGLPVNWAC